MHSPGKMLRSLQLTLDERLVDDNFRGDVRQLASLPCLHLLAHGLEVSLHSVNAQRDAVDERERLRLFREHGSKHAGANVPDNPVSGSTLWMMASHRDG